MNHVIETKDLTKVYGTGDIAVHALRGVNIVIDEGEFVAVMGPSGSGKSTLLNILGCLDRPSGGAYMLAGEDVSRLRRDRLAAIRNHRIGFVFQMYNLLPRQSALQNVMLPMLYDRRRDLSDKARRDRAMAALELVGLGDRLGHRPNELSGGQQQRVAIARAIVNEPSMILADEPTGNLDSKAGDEIIALLKSLYSNGATIVMVTHDSHDAAEAERIITFRDGLVVTEAGLTG